MLDALLILLLAPLAVGAVVVIAAGLILLCILCIPIAIVMVIYDAWINRKKNKKAKDGKVHESKL